jgi:CheY-like chemotaxis protein
VVDHVDVQREIAVKMLESLGYRAHGVDGGEAALDFLRRQGADLLVLDMILGHGMDGLETYRRAVLA